MPTAEKEHAVSLLEERLKRSKALVFSDFHGLTASEMVELRRELRKHGLEYRVVKNNVARIAVERLGIKDTDPYFRGPTGLCISYDDPALAFKISHALTKKFEHYKIKGGVLEGVVVSAAEAEQLANLPSRHELLAMLVNTLQAPMQQLASVLHAVIRDFVSVLDEVRKKREGEPPPPTS
ncbi:50S ribosomal protein L10 [bacterium HR07]|uniref:Large ribosomal subunit protein uL10 n=2 Tax=Candidatus Bipolaricaulota TaxID=67810 RepID=H5SJ91_9BACT|nr:50S ribosomal protein L10 [uncultured Acetothermia bacterium]BAL58189.1 50S ribosomal protein L10 [uncultured Acetothermia bacterium]BAL59899.1 50S ribosomal protein L10 [Candidatus Acetothermum autotrophicum]GBC75850.1 50S ribosomal protein L10 [bacterium HR07]